MSSSVSKDQELPALDSPFGPNAWRQPPREAILIDDKHAVMTRATFEQLPEYSATRPSGVYPGKLWRRHDGAHDPRCHPSEYRWMLGWYGLCQDQPDKCSVNFREVLIV